MRRRSGFTLVEVMVALLVGGIVLLGARVMFESLTDQAHRIADAAIVADREANADRELRALAGRLEVGTAPGTEFAGDPASATFASWCEVPAGWLERCIVQLSIEHERAGSALVARTSLGDTLVLRRGFRGGVIHYLESAVSGGSWIRVWGAGITAPVAFGIFLDRDTLIVRIGERG